MFLHIKRLALVSARAKDFVKTPIHYQNLKELVNTIVVGSNSRLANLNFWKRCGSAVLYNYQGFGLKELVRIVDSFGRISYRNELLFNLLARQFILYKNDIAIGDIPIILNAYAQCSCYHGFLFKALLDLLANSLEQGIQIPPSGLSLVLNSLKVAKPYSNIDHELLDILVKPLFINIKQFTAENLLLVLSSFASIGYENVGLLRIISSYLSTVDLTLRQTLDLARIFTDIGYFDKCLTETICKGVVNEGFSIPTSELVIILKFLKTVDGKVNQDIFKTIANIILRSKNVDHKIVFSAHTLLRSYGYGDIYLSRLCDGLTEEFRSYRTRQKICLLEGCIGYELPLYGFYESVLNSFKNIGDYSTLKHAKLEDSSEVSDLEFLNLFTLFNQLKYAHATAILLITLKENKRNIRNDYVGLKYYETLKSSYNNIDDFVKSLSTCKSTDELSAETRDDDYITNGIPIQYKSKKGTTPTARIVPNITVTAKLSRWSIPYTEEDLKNIRLVWEYIERQADNTGKLDCLLGIIHSDSPEFHVELLEKIQKSNEDSELVPAVLMSISSAIRTQGLTGLSYAKLTQGCHYLLCSADIHNISNASICTLVKFINENRDIGSKIILPITSTITQRITTLGAPSGIDDIESYKELRNLYNSSLLLLKTILTHRNQENAKELPARSTDTPLREMRQHTSSLLRLLCTHIRMMDIKYLPTLLQLLLQFDFREGKYLRLLIPFIDKAIEYDSDMQRVTSIETLCKQLDINYRE